MELQVFDTSEASGKAAALRGAEIIKAAIAGKGESAIILATGNSQLRMFEHLITLQDIDWSKVTCFHLDEYVDISDQHPASFRKYLREKFVSKVPAVKDFFYVEGDAEDTEQECARLDKLISRYEIDAAFIGIGENSHIAFNDPPADFDTEKPFLIVSLDTACRQQQMNEGWFSTLDEVPRKAISMSVRQIMKSGTIICTVPEKRKARAVKLTMEKEISNMYPATILRTHPSCVMFLDKDSAGLLERT